VFVGRAAPPNCASACSCCACARCCEQRTVTAMAKVGMSPEQRDAVLGAVAAVLHLGNITFQEGSEADSSKVASGEASHHLQAAGNASRPPCTAGCMQPPPALCQQQLQHCARACAWRRRCCVRARAAPVMLRTGMPRAATLLGVDRDALEHALTTRSRVMREGTIVSPLTTQAAIQNRSVAARTPRAAALAGVAVAGQALCAAALASRAHPDCPPHHPPHRAAGTRWPRWSTPRCLTGWWPPSTRPLARTATARPAWACWTFTALRALSTTIWSRWALRVWREAGAAGGS
jgi:hypothetical protein